MEKMDNKNVEAQSEIDNNKENKGSSVYKKLRILLLLVLIVFAFSLYRTLSTDIPSQPELSIETKGWDQINTIHIVKDSKSNSEIAYYKYCIVTKGTSKRKCDWQITNNKIITISESGDWDVYVKGVNINGTEGKTSKIHVLVDNDNPKILSASIYKITSTTVDVQIDAVDDLSGIDHIIYQITGQDPVTTNKLKFHFKDLQPVTEYMITIIVVDKAGNETKLLLPVKTLKEGQTLEDGIITDENAKEGNYTCENSNFTMPIVNITPDPEKWSTYKDVEINYGKNSCKHEYSLDQGKTWKEYDGTIRFVKAGYIMARSIKADNELNTGLIRVKYIDPIVPKISLDDVPSKFEYGDYYVLPTDVEFGAAGGTYACYVDGNKEGATNLLKVGKHIITCYAYGNNGLTTKITKNIEVKYRNESAQAWDGWVTLDIAYPPESVNRQWRLFDSSKVIGPTDTMYQWQDYTGPITIRLRDIEKVRIKYDINGVTVIQNYSSSELLVDIRAQSYRVPEGATTKVEITYDSTATGRYYRLNHGDWIPYTGRFEVPGNTFLEAKVERITDVKDDQGNVIGTVKDTSYEAVEIDLLPIYVGDGEDDIYDPNYIIVSSDDAPKTDFKTYSNTSTISIVSDFPFDSFVYRTSSSKFPNSSVQTWTVYDGPFEVLADTVIYVEAYKITNRGYLVVPNTYYVYGTPEGEDPDLPEAKGLVKLDILPEYNPLAIGSRTKVTLDYDPDEVSEVKYKINGSDYRKYTGEFTAAPHDVISAYAVSKTVDKISVYKSIVISKDDQNADEYLKGPNIIVTRLSNTRVNIDITTEYGARNIYYRIGGSGSWRTFNGTFDMSTGSMIEAMYIRESDGKYSDISTRTPSTIYNHGSSSYECGPSVYISASVSRKDKNAVVTVHPDCANVVKYSIDGVNYLNYTGPFKVTENTKIYAYAEKELTRRYAVYNITDINDTPSSNKPFAGNIQFVEDPNNASQIPNINSIKMTILYDSDATEKYYRLSKNDTWQVYTGPFYLDENTTVYAYEKTPNGIYRASKMVDYFAKGLPDPMIESNPDNSVAATIDTITITYGKNAVSKYYSIDDGPAIEYTGEFDVTENCIIQATSVDSEGNTTFSVYFVSNIQPIMSKVDKYEDFFILRFNFPNSAINKEYKQEEEIYWRNYNNNGILLIRGDKLSKYFNPNTGKLIVNGKDYTNDYYVYNGDLDDYVAHFKVRFDTIKNNPPAITPNTTAPAEEVKITIKYPDGVIAKEYKLVNENGDESDWLEYTEPFIINKNNVTIYARGKDSYKTYTTVSSYLVSNIMRSGTAIVSVNRGYQSLDIELNNVTTLGDIDFYEFSLDGMNYERSDTNKYTFNNLGVNTKYTVYARVIDKDTTVHGPYITDTSTLNFSKPQVYTQPKDNEWRNRKDVVIDYHEDYYNNIEYQKLYSLDNGTTWETYTGPFEITENSKIIAKTYVDDNNYILSDVYETTTVDSTPPVISNVALTGKSSRVIAKVTAEDKESGIKYYYYSIDGVNFEQSPKDEFAFTELNMDTEYTVYVKAENFVGDFTEVYSVSTKTVDIDVPIYTDIYGMSDDDIWLDEGEGWSYAKKVIIHYPYVDEDCVLQYSLDDGNTWETYFDGAIVEKENGTVIARIISGPNVVTASSITLTRIDRTEPTINLNGVPKSIEIGQAYDLPTAFTVDNTKSGGSAYCTANGDRVTTTENFRTGFINLKCTVTTGAGHSVSIERRQAVYTTLTYEVESVLDGIKTLNLADGDFNFKVKNGNKEETYVVELWNYTSETINEVVNKCDNVEDYKICALKYSGDLTIGPEGQIVPTARKNGLLIYVAGTLTNEGTISVSGKGGVAEGQNVYLWKNSDGYYEYVPATGATGGESSLLTARGSLAGTNGANGFFRETGGGASGGAYSGGNGYIKAGNGASGTSFGGGAGGGAVNANNNFNSNAVLAGENGLNGTGGLSNRGSSYTGKAYDGFGSNTNSAGGLLIIYANTYNNTGSVTADGVDEVGTDTNGNVMGGATGGGSINIFTNNLVSKGTTSVNGGTAIASTVANKPTVNGGAGGKGTVTYSVITDDGILGTKVNPYKIYTAQDLLDIKVHNIDYRDGYYELMNDIDLTGTVFESLGTSILPFSGHFNGNGYTISGVTDSLFGSIYNAEVKNLKLDNVNITSTTDNVGAIANIVTGESSITNIDVVGSVSGNNNVGGLVGYVDETTGKIFTLSNVSYSGTVNGLDYVGGLVGKVYNIETSTINIKTGSIAGTVSGRNYVGGSVGYIEESLYSHVNISEIINSSDVTASYSYAGGIVGYALNKDKDATINIVSSYNEGNITASNYAGGIVGYSKGIVDATPNTISKSYSTGTISATLTNTNVVVNYPAGGNTNVNSVGAGGIIGYGEYTNINNSFSTGEVNAKNLVGSLAGDVKNSTILNSYAIGKTTFDSTIRVENTFRGGLVGRSADSTATNSYFASETVGIQRTALGKNYRIQELMYENTYNDYDFENTWEIDETTSLAYLKGLPKPITVGNIEHVTLAGHGTVEDPYIVTTPDEFRSIKYDISANYKQGNDIDFEGTSAYVLTEEKALFSGSYDGANYKLSNFNIDNNTNYTAIFGYVSTIDIKNVNIENATILGKENSSILIGYLTDSITADNININGTLTGTKNVGGLIGYYYNATNDTVPISIKDVVVDVHVTGTENVGALIGRLEHRKNGSVTIKNISSTNTTSVIGTTVDGGIIGHVYNVAKGTITLDNLSSSGTVTGTNNSIGGVVGTLQNVDTGIVNFDNNHSNAYVTGNSNVGGLVGYQYDQLTGTQRVYRSYFEGSVVGTGNNVGGISGYAYSSRKDVNSIRECYSEGSVTGIDNVGNIVGQSYYTNIYDSFSTGTVTGRNAVASGVGYLNNSNIYRIYSTGKLTSTGTTNVGALVGTYSNSVEANSYFLGQTIGYQYSPLGTIKKGYLMVQEATYENYDFDDIWTIDEGETTAYLKNVRKPNLNSKTALGYHELQGTGTIEDPFLIYNYADLDDIRYNLEAHYKFMDDVDVENREFEPIAMQPVPYSGSVGNQPIYFTGTIDGNNHIIKNINIVGNKDYNALIAYAKDANIKDLTLEGFNVTGRHYTSLLVGYDQGKLELSNIDVKDSVLNATGENVGTLVGYQQYSGKTTTNVDDVNVISTVVNGTNNVGGLVGYINVGGESTIDLTNINSNVTMTVNTYTGGVVGRINAGNKANINVSDIETSGTISGKDGTIGGVIGYMNLNQDSHTSITNATNSAAIIGNRAAGILASVDNNSNSSFTLDNLVNTGTITKYSNGSYYGGLLGYVNNAGVGVVELEDSTNSADILGYSQVGGLVGLLQNYSSGTIKVHDSYNTGNISGREYSGGLVGYTYNRVANGNLTVEKGYSTGTVTTDGGSYTGGIVGRSYAVGNSYATFKQLYSNNNVTSVGSYTGGLIGQTENTTIIDTYSLGTLTGNDYTGGVVGNLTSSTITNSYTVGKVNITGVNTGGLVGYTSNSVVTDSYFSSEISTVIRKVIGTTEKLRYMVLPDIYTNWDKEEIWAQEVDELPYLKGLPKPDMLAKSDYEVHELEGEGTKNNPYVINNLDDYNYVKYELDAYYLLNTDLDLNGEALSPIGEKTVPFTGEFNGNNHTISNFTMSGEYVGIFASTKDAKIYDLTVSDFTYTGASYTGGLIGSATSSLYLDNINLSGNITGTSYLGGIIGNYTNGTDSDIKDVNYTGNITGTTYLGGAIGSAVTTTEDINIDNMVLTTNVVGTGAYVGGFAGYASGNLTVTDSDITGSVVTNGNYAGGIAGYYIRNVDLNSSFENININLTQLKGASNTGGICGYVQNSKDGLLKISNITVDTTVTGTTYVGGASGYAGTGAGGVEFSDLTLNTPITATGNYAGGIAGQFINSGTGVVTMKDNTVSYGVETTRDYVGGLFGNVQLTGNGKIKITNIPVNHNIKGASYVGGLVGYLYNSSTEGTINIDDIYAEGNVTATGSYIGGLVGKSEGRSTGGITIDSTHYIGDVSGVSYVGGFVGQTVQAGKGTNSINMAYTTGNVTGTGNYVAGMVGEISAVSGSVASVTKAYSNNTVTANTYAGGISGKTTYAIIRDVYTLAPINANDYLASFIANANYTTINDSYALGAVNVLTPLNNNRGGFVQSASNSTATNSYFSSRFTRVIKTALGINIAYDKMLTVDSCYIMWDFENTWDIVYEQGPAFLRGLPKPEFSEELTNYVPMAGTGTENDPYIIKDYLDLTDIMGYPDAYYEIVNDIVVPEEVSFYPFGSSTDPFTGKINGNNHKITGIKINSNLNELGLFGKLDGAEIKNLIIEDATITSTMASTEKVGFLAGNAVNSVIDNVTVTGTIDAKGKVIGGLVGETDGTTSITNVTTEVTIKNATTNIGGLVGKHVSTTDSSLVVNNITMNNTITGTEKVGNLFGEVVNNNNSTTTIRDITNDGSITGTANVGGLIGAVTNSDTSVFSIKDSVGTVRVSGTSNVGGIVGNEANTSSEVLVIDNYDVEGSITNTGANTGMVVGIMSNAAAGKTTINDVNADVVMTAVNNAGGLVGNISNSATGSIDITNSSVVGTITSTGTNIGGLVGTFTNASTTNSLIDNCVSSANINGKINTGGLVGNISNTLASNVTISNSYYDGDITVPDGGSVAGGIAAIVTGNTNGRIIIDTVYVKSNMTGYVNTSGLIAQANYTDISNAFVYARINAKSGGQLVGTLNNSTITDAYSYGNMVTNANGNVVLTGTNNTLTNVYATNRNRFTNDNVVFLDENEVRNSASFVGFDFDNVWAIENDQLPYLRRFANPNLTSINPNNLPTSYTVGSLAEFFDKEGLTDGLYKVDVTTPSETVTYYVDLYVYNGDTIIDNVTYIGGPADNGSASDYGTNMAAMLVYGDLTITNTGKLIPFYDQYGGPKGFTISVTGKLVNEGEINNQHGAKAVGNNVYLYKNADGSYEYVPAYGTGAAVAGSDVPQENSSIRRSLGGGGGGMKYTWGTPGSGTKSTAYSGGTGGAGINWSSGVAAAGENGGNGGYCTRTGTGGRCGCSGAGNPNGGTGGLLVIYANEFDNNGSLIAKGTNGFDCSYSHGSYGGSSGGGSINIFVKQDTFVADYLQTPQDVYNSILGTTNVNGGQFGGWGGNGTVNIGTVTNNQYQDLLKYVSHEKDVLTFEATTPVITVNSTTCALTKTVTIDYRGAAVKEYSVDLGTTWNTYTDPITISEVTTIIARSKDSSGVFIGASSFVVEKVACFEADSLVSAIRDNDLNSGRYTFNINNTKYPLHVYNYTESQTWDTEMKFGDDNDVSTKADEYAKSMVVVKVNGDLTIGSNGNVLPYYTEYGGPKGFMLYVTGTLTNNGKIDNSHGAYAKGENVYLWKNADGTYEYVPARGSIGGEEVTAYWDDAWLRGNDGIAGSISNTRATGGGGAGGANIGDEGGYVRSGAGGQGTSYSGGSGGGSAHGNSYDIVLIGGTADSNGGAGGGASAYRYRSSWASRAAGGGAGNPGGNGAINGYATTDGKGENGTGGLLIISANKMINNGSVTANGSKGKDYGTTGGSSGGGSINIFSINGYTGNGLIEANGGETPNTTGGSGGEGSISVGMLVDNSYYSTTFAYTGTQQVFKAPLSGIYKIEAWGAQGGSYASKDGGYGGYSSGLINLSQNERLFINVGGTTNTTSGGYNGGGAAGANYNAKGGGGATHVATATGLLSTLENNKDSIIIVAGGGGGIDNYSGGSNGGSGGGAVGVAGDLAGSGSLTKAQGGTQDGPGSSASGACTGSPASFGKGGSQCSDHGGGGGGGYYGGGGGAYNGGIVASGAGGSGYIGNDSLSSAKMFCYNCQESTVSKKYTINTSPSIGTSSERDLVNCPNGYSSTPISKCAKVGNGYVKITYIGE